MEWLQMFRWYPGTQQRNASTECASTMVLQMYTADPLWAEIANEPSQFECPASVTADRCGECPGAALMLNGTHLNSNIVDFFQRNLAVMLNVSMDEIPPVLDAQYSVWDDMNPQTRASSLHTWLPGFRWWEAYEAALQPSSDLPLHLIGESMSMHQGWGEGALHTAEYFLQEKLGLAAPAWLSHKQYCESMPFYPSQRRNSAAGSI